MIKRFGAGLSIWLASWPDDRFDLCHGRGCQRDFKRLRRDESFEARKSRVSTCEKSRKMETGEDNT